MGWERWEAYLIECQRQPICWGNLVVCSHALLFCQKGGVHTYWPAKKCAGDVCNLRLAMFTDRLLNIPIYFSLRISRPRYFPKTSHSKQPFVLVKVFHQFSWRPLGNFAMENHPELVVTIPPRNHRQVHASCNAWWCCACGITWWRRMERWRRKKAPWRPINGHVRNRFIGGSYQKAYGRARKW